MSDPSKMYLITFNKIGENGKTGLIAGQCIKFYQITFVKYFADPHLLFRPSQVLNIQIIDLKEGE